MLGYLKKFNNLSVELRQKVSSPEAMTAIEELEKKYRLPLASFIMRVMVKEIAFKDLTSFLLKENLTAVAAEQLAEELKAKTFFSLGNYLSLGAALAQPGEPEQEAAPLSSAAPISAFKPPAQRFRSSEKQLVKGASFFFSPDDEQEIRELAKKIDVAKKTELPAAKIEARLAAIINRTQINFGSADLADRFKQILKTYLRGIRNRLETESTLTKPFLSGGLNFDDNSAQKVIAMADKIVHPVKSRSAGIPQEAELFNGVNPVKSRSAGIPQEAELFNGVNPVKSRSAGIPQEAELFNGVNSQADSPAGPAEEIIELPAKPRILAAEKTETAKPLVERDAPYDFSKLAKLKKNSGSIKPELEDASHELAPLTPALAPIKPGATSPVAKKEPSPARIGNKSVFPPRLAAIPTKRYQEPDSPTLPKQAADANQMPLIRRRFEAENLNQNQKVRVEDVKYVPRVMSPLDEIKYLDLVNFRRLDKDPFRAVEKIKSKISLLEEEGYGKKLEAIKFWRSGPLNRLYLEIGHSSISGNKPVDVIIEERKIAARDYLTAAEFKVIMDLNKSLRF